MFFSIYISNAGAELHEWSFCQRDIRALSAPLFWLKVRDLALAASTNWPIATV